ncbi:hypothetical protein EV361DRAFT_952635 [Lentinula raphanica]|nr:hypothetical protein EV361DRAFT_952635 [Lentinula raphanica]
MARRSQRVNDKDPTSGDTHVQRSTTDSNVGSKHARDEAEDAGDYEEADDDDAPKRKRKRSKKAAQPSAESSTPSSSNIVVQRPESSIKRQRVPEHFRKVRGKLGLLEKLAKDMPLDVILEIFCYLEPRDLLRLARTSKDLRGILMSKSSENIWRTARGNVEGLPPCPVDLNEPQYANLLFESYCHVCMRSGRCVIILWNFRMRSCRKCLQTFPKVTDSHPLDYWEIIPQEYVRLDITRRNLYCDIRNTEIEQRYKAEYDALETPEDRKTWIGLKLDERCATEQHNELLNDWVRGSLQNRANELVALRNDRKAAILDRLEEIGWRNEAEMIMRGSPHDDDPFSNLKSVRQPKKLTDHGWRSIKNGLVKFLSDAKDERIARERTLLLSHRVTLARETYNGIRSKSDLRVPFPTNGDVLCDQVFRTFIWDTPEDVYLKVALYRSKMLEHLPAILKEWRAAADQKLLAIMQQSRPTATISDLHLATTVFECDRSIAPFDSLINTLPVYCDGPWTPLPLVFSDTHSDIARRLVAACSLDPDTATLQDIYDANPLFECTPCKRDLHDWDGGRLFMRWPIALAHCVQCGHDELSHPLITNHLSEDEKQNVLACEPSSTSSYTSPVCCVHCHEEASPCELVKHLKTEHNDVVDFPDSEKLQALREHWYWNPYLPLMHMGESFRYRG